MFEFQGKKYKQCDPSAKAKVVTKNGIPNLFVNDIPTEPLSYFGNTEWPRWEKNVADEIHYAAKQGIHIHTMVIHFPINSPENNTFDDSHIRKVLDYCIQADPQGYFIPRIHLYPADKDWWKKNHPEAFVTFSDGSKSEISISCDEWLNQAVTALDKGIEYINSKEEYGRCVIGYHPSCQNTGEWFYHDYREKGIDFSESNRKGFGIWLKEKYKDIGAMNRDFKTDYPDFDCVKIPEIPHNLPGVDSSRAILDKDKRDVVAFYDYINSLTVKRIEQISLFIKKKTMNDNLVMIFYGYSFELPDPKSGHCCLGELLKSPHVDLLASPISYQDRAQGGMLSYMAPVDSVSANGKIWLVEDDTRTFLAVDKTENDADFNPTIESREDTEEIHKRNMASITRRGIGVWFMDLWASGWLNDEDLWKNIGNLCEIYKEYKKSMKPYHPEVAFILDEKSHYYLENPWKHGDRIAYMQRQAIYRSGIDFGLYLQSDLLDEKIPKCKLYVFLNAFCIDDKYMEAINRIKKDDSVLLWVYGPDIYNNKYTNQATGMNLVYHDEKILSEISLNDGTQAGDNDEIEPFYSIQDKEAKILGVYKNTGLGAYGVKTNSGYTSVFYGNTMLSTDIIRETARLAKASVYCESNDVIEGGDLITIHSSEKGNKEIFSDESLTDLFLNRTIKPVDGIVRINMEKHKTKIMKKNG